MKTTKTKKLFPRLIGDLFRFYPVKLPVTLFLILVSAVSAAIPAVFLEKVIEILKGWLERGEVVTWETVRPEIVRLLIILVSIYVVSLIANYVYHRMLAVMTQGILDRFRRRMFDHMQSLPVKYFDTHIHGDIMSLYTNDTDTLRQMIGESLPQILVSGIIVVSVFALMIWYSLWLTAVVLAGVICMFLVTKSIGGKSSKYFVLLQQRVGRLEGYIQETMNGQKVVKVFCHEEESKRDYDAINDAVCEASTRANRFANMLMPLMFNIGNIMYVAVAIVGGILLTKGVFNPSLAYVTEKLQAGAPATVLGIGALVVYLNMTKQFSGNIGQVSGQVNSVVMGMAGARRIYGLLDEPCEVDEGYVTLVNAREENGELIECRERTGIWAWKHPHMADGTVTYTRLMGDVRMFDVDFGYVPDHIVLHGVTLYAEPGQKVAFVGATGAGKTTITNLINRFYDIADGKIRYDGININKIQKSALRRSLGVVLQDTNLFSGTVMENIRYGKLDATDEECIAAAKLVSADDFITRLPKGYETELVANGANLSQGQRQLIAIARAAVADPPVMILDEATSSIDTHTEEIVQRGMDALMHGRTVFVIAHRLSTVKNADVIMVLDHGVIIERGSHEDLIAKRGRYYQLYTGAFELD
ncbi:MAG: ABC transporter ATP-binding protein [Clostridia bacterium]|nr:ABC transporter ATP-binding protein [Clostridia bacterium]MDY6184457.1 ABC transporter ATP-binding protein [Eubacteriales bacterium]